eukprot:g14833.t1
MTSPAEQMPTGNGDEQGDGPRIADVDSDDEQNSFITPLDPQEWGRRFQAEMLEPLEECFLFQHGPLIVNTLPESEDFETAAQAKIDELEKTFDEDMSKPEKAVFSPMRSVVSAFMKMLQSFPGADLQYSPEKDADRWKSRRFLCYMASALHIAIRYAHKDGEALAMKERPTLAKFLKVAGPLATTYTSMRKSTLLQCQFRCLMLDPQFSCHPFVKILFSEEQIFRCNKLS